MALSIADIDRWDPESVSAVGAACTARATAATHASARANALSAFDEWKGAAADAAQGRTRALATGMDEHARTASAIAGATTTAAHEVEQIKSHLSRLRSTLGQYGVIVDAASSRAVPAVDVSSLPPPRRQLVAQMTAVGQQQLDHLRAAANLTDAHLAAALRTTGDDFDLDTQYVRAQGVVGGDIPLGFQESSVECGAYITALTQLTTTYLSLASQCCGNG